MPTTISGTTGIANDGTIVSAGSIKATATGFIFPDNTTQSTAAAGGTSGQVFATPGTFSGASGFTVPAGVTAVKVTVIGGGGGGGSASNNSSAGGGGGGGGMAVKWVTGLTPGDQITVTVGAGGSAASAGGTSSFAAYCSATGGSGGTSNVTGSSGGGAGGAGSGGDLNFTGVNGSSTLTYTFGTCPGTTVRISGAGGATQGDNIVRFGNSTTTQSSLIVNLGSRGQWGGGGSGRTSEGAGTAGDGYGSGGSGAFRATTTQTGGAGSGGLVVVEW